MLKKMKVGQSRHLLSKDRSAVIADFEKRGEIFRAMEQITAALTTHSFKGSKGFELNAGDTINVIDKKGKEMLFKVFRVVGGMPILIEPNKGQTDMGLIDRLLLAWQVFTGKFFKKNPQ